MQRKTSRVLSYLLAARFSIEMEKTRKSTIPSSPKPWFNTLKQFVGKLPSICLNVFDHFVGLALKGLKQF